jgi:hypothetical protein
MVWFKDEDYSYGLKKFVDNLQNKYLRIKKYKEKLMFKYNV